MTKVRLLVPCRTFGSKTDVLRQFHNGSAWFCVEQSKHYLSIRKCLYKAIPLKGPWPVSPPCRLFLFPSSYDSRWHGQMPRLRSLCRFEVENLRIKITDFIFRTFSFERIELHKGLHIQDSANLLRFGLRNLFEKITHLNERS